MTTLSEYRSDLRDMGNFPTNDTRITDAVIDREVNRALKRIAMLHDWPWLQAEAVFTTVAGQQSYALPGFFLRALSVRHEDSASALALRSIQEVDLITGTSQPEVYAVNGSRIFFGASPDGAYRIRMRYTRQENVLAADQDAPLIPDYWNDGVYEAALVELYRTAKDTDAAMLAEQRFQQWLKDTVRNVPQTRASIRVRVRPGGLI